MTRTIVVVLLILFVGGCGTSYTLPEAIIGVPLTGASEFENVRTALATLAVKRSLFSAVSTEWRSLKGQDAIYFSEFAPRGIRFSPERWSTSRMSMEFQQYSPNCALVTIHEHSPRWTSTTLDAIDEIEAQLKSATGGRANLLVKPAKDFDGTPEKYERNVDRPNELEELCVRMGLPDPRKSSSDVPAA